MPKPGKSIPDGHHSLQSYLVIRDVPKAIDFYKKAFGATEVMRSAGPGGKIVHARLMIGDSSLFLTEEVIDWGNKSPLTLGGTPMAIFYYCPNVDEVFKRAIDSGATSKMPVADQFWGDRWGALTDPFGHNWQIATHKWDLTPEELKAAQEESMAKMLAKPS